MKNILQIKLLFLLFLLGVNYIVKAQTATDVPIAGLTSPVIGSLTYQYPPTNCPWMGNSIWGLCQHQTGGHTSTGGVNDANDIHAWDCNLSNNLDSGKDVYPVEDGWVSHLTGWSGNSVGQLLIRHVTNGKTWYSGYLHMSNITNKKATNGSFISKNEVIGKISNVSPNTMSDHLHFAVYYYNGSKLISVNRTFNERQVCPQTPNTTYPANNSTVSTPIIFDWNDVSSTAQYRIQVSTSSTGWSATDGFTNLSTESSTIRVNQNTNNNSLYNWSSTSLYPPQPNTTYYYTVKNFDCGQNSSYSPVKSFTTSCTGAIPSPISPSNGQTNVSTPVLLDWNDVGNNPEYRVQVSTTSAGWSPTSGFTNLSTESATIRVNQNTNDISSFNWGFTSLYPPQSGTTYYWTVKAYSCFQNSDYSPVRSFTVGSSSGCNPPTTTLSSPSSGTNYNVGQNINLQWTGNGNGCTIQDYQIELTAPNGNTTSPIQTTNNFSFTAPSNGLGTWQWRVRTRNANGVWGNYTGSRSFTISQSTTNFTISVSANPSIGGGVTGGGSFSNGSGCSVVATPNTGYTFTNWTENGTVVSTNSTYTFTVSSNRSLVANFTQQGTWYTCPNYNFSPSINSNWNTSSSSLQTSSNKIYRFLAIPGRTYTFKTGCGDGATATFNTVLNLLDNNCNTIASDDNSCESQRSTIQWTCNYTSTNWVYLMVRGFSTSNSGDYTLAYREITPTSTYNVSTSSLPIVGGSTSGSGNYNQGQSCTVTATSNSGYAFSHWSENGTSVSSNASYTFNVTANRSLVANFTQNQTGNGCNGGTQYPGNTLIPSSTWKTQSGIYTGDYSLYRVYPGVTYEWSMCPTDGAVANFDSQLTLIRYSDNQIIKFNNDYCGDDAKIIWTSDFYGDVKVLLNKYNCQSNNDWGTIAYRISNPSDYSSIVVSSSPYYMGNVAGEGSFVNGQTVTVTATPNNGYQFASWKENGNVVSTSSTYQFTVNGNRNLVANFTTALGTNETDKEKSEVSPNPFNDFLQVRSEKSDIIGIQLFDSSGKLVLTKDLAKKVKECKLNTSKVIKGIYILKIKKENKIETHKVIKK